ncbi:uncharacterized protein LOC131149576 isoform X3 [Malania oleifera]|uniref:uncharacterized protein LOC131149576 isoform X3 n=1 Tax=Malania oleifera TaxID=397392 RepID=UPI0025AE8F75|nr:uncharacterized protein LOC131149576 isoform X3 [Malania oleifera]
MEEDSLPSVRRPPKVLKLGEEDERKMQPRQKRHMDFPTTTTATTSKTNSSSPFKLPDGWVVIKKPRPYAQGHRSDKLPTSPLEPRGAEPNLGAASASPRSRCSSNIRMPRCLPLRHVRGSYNCLLLTWVMLCSKMVKKLFNETIEFSKIRRKYRQ